jgi:hypothetical protein
MQQKEIEVKVYLTDEFNRRNMNEFRQAAYDAGFNQKQVDFFEEFVAKQPHSHQVEEIIGVDDYMAQILEEGDEDGEETEE